MNGSKGDTGVRKLDSIDLKILSVLQENARVANVDLAAEVHLSPSPCLARVRTLEREGFISRYVTLLDPRTVGIGVNVFVQVRLEKQVEPALSLFEKAVATRRACDLASSARGPENSSSTVVPHNHSQRSK